MIGWPQILLKILFNEMASKCRSSMQCALGSFFSTLLLQCFLNVVGTEGGHKIFDYQIGGHKKLPRCICDPPILKKLTAPW